MITDASFREAFLHDGYVILPGAVPADRLESLRDAYDVIVARAREADPDWYTTATARTDIAPYLDARTAETLVFALEEHTFGVSAGVLGCEANKVGLTFVSVLCNPEFEPTETSPSGQSWGTDPRNWHRDIRPDHNAPLSALLADEEANGPGYAQWNIALYDDAILYFIPGSHRRLTSQVESMQLQSDRGTQTPLPDCVCAELKPGDGVVYNNMLLHWGSKYTRRQKRRTIHLGYRTFGRFLPNQRECRLPEGVREVLPTDSPQRRKLEESFGLFRDEYALIREILAAVIAGDVARFEAGLERLHPSTEGRLRCVILLSKIARDMCLQSREKQNKQGSDGGTPTEVDALQQHIASRFTAEELETLWARFGVLDAMVRCGEPIHVNGFLGPPTDYLFEELPSGLTIDRAVEGMFGENQ